MEKWFESNWITLTGWIISIIVVFLGSWFSVKFGYKSYKRQSFFDEKVKSYKEVSLAMNEALEKMVIITSFFEKISNKEDITYKIRVNKYNSFIEKNNFFFKCTEENVIFLSEESIKTLRSLHALFKEQGEWYDNMYLEPNMRSYAQQMSIKVIERNEKIKELVEECNSLAKTDLEIGTN